MRLANRRRILALRKPGNPPSQVSLLSAQLFNTKCDVGSRATCLLTKPMYPNTLRDRTTRLAHANVSLSNVLHSLMKSWRFQLLRAFLSEESGGGVGKHPREIRSSEFAQSTKKARSLHERSLGLKPHHEQGEL